MARPYFTGNYGSALARVDTRPIIEAGKATGQMYAQMGKDIGGVIKEYGLNKEKQKKQKAGIKSAVNFLEEQGERDPSQKDRYDLMREQLLDEDTSLTERSALADEGFKQLTLSSQLQSQRLNQDTVRMANKFAEDTNEYHANVIKDQSILSRLNRELTQELDPKKRELLGKQIDETIADLSLRPKERKEREMQLRDRAGRRAEYPESIKARDERTLVGKQIKGLDISHDNKAALTKYYETQGDLGWAKLNLAGQSPTFSAQFKPLAELQGKLLSQNVVVPVGTDDHQKGQRISFQEYQEFHGKDPDIYPLTGLAASLDAQLKTLERQTQELMDEQRVMVDTGTDEQPPGGVETGQESSLEMLGGDVPVLTPPQRSGLQTGAEAVTGMIPDFVSDEVLEHRLQEMAEQFPSLKTALEGPQGKEVFKRLMGLRK